MSNVKAKKKKPFIVNMTLFRKLLDSLRKKDKTNNNNNTTSSSSHNSLYDSSRQNLWLSTTNNNTGGGNNDNSSSTSSPKSNVSSGSSLENNLGMAIDEYFFHCAGLLGKPEYVKEILDKKEKANVKDHVCILNSFLEWIGLYIL